MYSHGNIRSHKCAIVESTMSKCDSISVYKILYVEETGKQEMLNILNLCRKNNVIPED